MRQSIRRFERGSTLIEILVSMLILSMGIIALMSTQTRTAMGIRESESISRVAQAAQNMAEAMLIKPQLIDQRTNKEDDDTIFRLNKDYSKYEITGCTGDAFDFGLQDEAWEDSVKNDFCAAMREVVGIPEGEAIWPSLLYVEIQNNKRIDEEIIMLEAAPYIALSDFSVDEDSKLKAGVQTVLRVFWRMDEESQTVYSYQIALGE